MNRQPAETAKLSALAQFTVGDALEKPHGIAIFCALADRVAQEEFEQDLSAEMMYGEAVKNLGPSEKEMMELEEEEFRGDLRRGDA